MVKNIKTIVMLIAVLIISYGLAAGYLLYSYYNKTLADARKTSTSYAESRAAQISDYLSQGLTVARTIDVMMSTANEKYSYDMMPYVYDALKKLAADNKDFSAVTITWDQSVADREWNKPFGRIRMRGYMYNGLPNIITDTLDKDGEVLSENFYRLKNSQNIILLSNPFINNVDYRGKDAGKYVMSISTKMDAGDKFLGTVSIEIPVEKMVAMAEDTPLGFVGQCYIIASNGKLVNHNNPELVNTLFRDAYSGIDNDGSITKTWTDGRVATTDYETKNDGKTHLVFAPIKIEDANAVWCFVSEMPYNQITKHVNSNTIKFFMLALAGFLLLIIFMLSMLNHSTSPISKVVDILHKIEDGQFDKISTLKSNDEITDELYNSVNAMATRMKRTTAFAKRIGQGNFDKNFTADSEQDIMGVALLDMQKNLIRAQEDEKRRVEENEKLSWSQNGLAQLGEYLRLSNNDISEFSYNIISFLVKYVGAMQGGMFIAEEKDGKKILNLKATYAFDRKKQLENTVEFGESLVGRCALEKKTIFLTDIPDGYLYITSGLGENKPKCLLLEPLQFEDEVLGVVELASLDILQEHHIKFFDSVAERIGSTISNIKKNINNAELLNRFRKQSDELSRREREISNSYENIRIAQEEVHQNEMETVAILDVLSQSSIIMRYDLTGKVLDMRDITLPVTGYRESDIVGHSIKEIYAVTKNEMESFDAFWADVVTGQTKIRNFKRGKITFRETFTLIRDNKGNPYKVVSIAVPDSDVSFQDIVDKKA
mgnify:CR=1 FL=1